GGRSVILITHKLREVLNLAQRITVLRQGRVVAVTEAAQATPDALARLMVGEVIAPAVRADRAAAAVPLLEVRDLRLRDRRGAAALRGLSLSVHAGEMVGAAALLAHRTAAHAYDRRARAPRDRALRGARRAPRAGHGQPLRRHHAAPGGGARAGGGSLRADRCLSDAWCRYSRRAGHPPLAARPARAEARCRADLRRPRRDHGPVRPGDRALRGAHCR